MLTDQEIAEAKRALKELADEAQGNGNSEGWIAAQERPILAIIAAHEAKAAPAVPQGEPVGYQQLFNAIAKATHIEGRGIAISVKAFSDAIGPLYAAPSQEPTWDQNADVCKGAWSLGTACGKCAKCIATKPAQEPVTLTDGMVTAGARALCDIAADSCNVDREDNWYMYGDVYKSDAKACIIAALREKEGGK